MIINKVLLKTDHMHEDFLIQIKSIPADVYFSNKISSPEIITINTFTWEPKWTHTGLKSQTTLKCRSVYMTICMEILLR